MGLFWISYWQVGNMLPIRATLPGWAIGSDWLTRNDFITSSTQHKGYSVKINHLTVHFEPLQISSSTNELDDEGSVILNHRASLLTLLNIISQVKVTVWCVIFRTLKDSSLQINSLASNDCFSNRNVFQNGVNALSKMVNHFFVKSLKFCVVRTIQLHSNFTSIFFDKALTPFCKTFLWLKQLFDAKLEDYHFSVFQKLR